MSEEIPTLRVLSPAQVDDFVTINEPVEPAARDQAMAIISDIKVGCRWRVVS
jgi:hypothetical protein